MLHKSYTPFAGLTLHDPSCMPLFEPMMARYLQSPFVRQFLLDRNPKYSHNSTFLQSFSYACMYYPSTGQPPSQKANSQPKPFLDLGDFLVYHQVHDGIAVGTIFNKNEVHTLAAIRDTVMTKLSLSKRPRVRNFAIDLRVKDIELVEFAWMEDDSLIVACRRLHPSIYAPHKPYVLSADLLFFPILTHPNEITDPPLFRALLNETSAFCSFCGTQGIGVCRCHPSCKVRAPTNAPHNSSTASKHIVNESITETGCDDAFYNSTQKMVPDVSRTWSNYSRRIMHLNQSGAFFCQWYKRSSCGTSLVSTIAPRHPIPYKFITGKKTDTMRLITLYLHRFHIATGPKDISSELRLKPPANVYDDDVDSVVNSGDSVLVKDLDVTDEYKRGDCSSVYMEPFEVCTSMVSLLPSSSVEGNEQLSENDDDSLKWNKSLAIEEVQINLEHEDGTDNNSALTEGKTVVVKYGDVSVANKKERLKHFMNTYVKDVRCLPCKKTFSKRSNLVRHIETKHFQLKPFQCERCSKRFGHSNHLRRHVAKLHAHDSRKLMTT